MALHTKPLDHRVPVRAGKASGAVWCGAGQQPQHTGSPGPVLHAQ